jgi:hypothetical protein
MGNCFFRYHDSLKSGIFVLKDIRFLGSQSLPTVEKSNGIRKLNFLNFLQPFTNWLGNQ